MDIWVTIEKKSTYLHPCINYSVSLCEDTGHIINL